MNRHGTEFKYILEDVVRSSQQRAHGESSSNPQSRMNLDPSLRQTFDRSAINPQYGITQHLPQQQGGPPNTEQQHLQGEPGNDPSTAGEIDKDSE
uniref:Uncharacterized protein n=2 Tax=Meloidogyne TaxID=189290 RepID=A0A914LQ23_MELIC